MLGKTAYPTYELRFTHINPPCAVFFCPARRDGKLVACLATFFPIITRSLVCQDQQKRLIL